MYQLEIKYFYPLTEQIPLELDFTPCEEYAKQRNANCVFNGFGLMLTVNGTGAQWSTMPNNIEPNFTIDIDQTPITVVSKQKPNFVKRWIYKTLGMKWKSK